MKRCPKCNRNYPTDTQRFCTHDGGMLMPVEVPTGEIPEAERLSADAPTRVISRDLPSEDTIQFDPFRTRIDVPPERTSEVRGRDTRDLAPQMPAPQVPPTSAPLPPPAAPRKKSRAPLIMAILAVLFILVVAVGVGAYFVIPKILPMIQARRSGIAAPAAQNPNQSAPVVESSPGEIAKSTNGNVSPAAAENEPPPYQPPADAVQFVNTNKNLDGKLAEHYVDFSFYFPERWVKDPKSGVAGSSNFVKVERRLPPDFTQENFAVGWYSS